MAGVRHQSDQLSLGGILCIVGIVGLNTAFSVFEQGGNEVSITAPQTWLPEYTIHFGVGLLVTAVIVGHLRRWDQPDHPE